MPELWDLYDRFKMPLGRTHIRGEKLNDGEFHIVVNILPVNNDGKILITKRHLDKNFGGKWEITGGSVVAGETSLQGAVRELFEETGLKSNEREISYYGTIIRENTNSIHDFYLYNGEFSDGDITLQEGETIDFKIISPDEILKMVKSGEFIDFTYNRIKGIFPEIFCEGMTID